jgi:hypothetical protein
VALARSDGLIADFSGGHQGAVRNAFGQPINVVLDSELGAESRVWFATTGDERDRALRFHFELRPTARQPRAYVGLFTDFARIIDRGFDVSRFSKITFTASLAPAVDPTSLDVFVSLDTIRGGVVEGICDAHEARISGLTSTPTRFEIPLANLRLPEWRGSEAEPSLNLERAFRLGFAIKSTAPIEGYLNIDSIRFE